MYVLNGISSDDWKVCLRVASKVAGHIALYITGIERMCKLM